MSVLDPSGRDGSPRFRRPEARSPLATWRRLCERSRDERGELMIETIAALVLIPALLLIFVSTQTATDRVQSMTQVSTIDQQIINDIYEEANVRPWRCLGFNPLVETTTDAATSRVVSTCSPDPKFAPFNTATVNGQTIKVKTTVHWATPGLDSTSPAGSFGIKVVGVTLTYQAHKSKTAPATVYTSTRNFTPDPTHAVPAAGGASLPSPDPNIPQR
jgi:Tfp pilus assembly protein PilV